MPGEILLNLACFALSLKASLHVYPAKTRHPSGVFFIFNGENFFV